MRSEMNIIVIDRDEYVKTCPCVFLAHNSLCTGKWMEKGAEKQEHNVAYIVITPDINAGFSLSSHDTFLLINAFVPLQLLQQGKDETHHRHPGLLLININCQ